MSQFDLSKDYYAIIGAEEETSSRDLERLYKRRAAQMHPDRGGIDLGGARRARRGSRGPAAQSAAASRPGPCRRS